MNPDPNGGLLVPSGLTLMPFQVAGVNYLLDHQNVILGDEMGLGKTPQSIVLLNNIAWRRVLIVVPAFLRLNWQKEIRRWLDRDATISIVWEGRDIPTGDIVICSYDLMAQTQKRKPDEPEKSKPTLCPAAAYIQKTPWDVQICDEAHYLKNSKAKRTKATLSVKAIRFVAATGTPILNRPVEIFTLAHRCDKAAFPNWFWYVKRYCNPPEAPIWLADGTFKPLGEIQVGDSVMGWGLGELRSRARLGGRKTQLMPSVVTHIARRQSAIVRVTLVSGKVVRCTPDHLWLSGRSSQKFRDGWKFISPKVGRKLVNAVDIPESPTLSEKEDWAYLAGIYDGEGTWPFIAQCKKSNPLVHRRIRMILERLKIPFTQSDDGFTLLGGRQTAVRMINNARPAKTAHILKRVCGSQFMRPDEIVSVDPDGDGEVISLTTTTGNYVAWGCCSKNCDAHDNGFGYDVRGASNLGELQQKLKASCMIRRLKKDVLTDLPPKTRQIIELPPSKEMKQVLDRENQAWSLHEDTLAALAERRDRAAILGDEDEYREAAKLLKGAYTVAFGEMSTVRKETALAKLSICLQHIEDTLEQVEKLIIFAHHRAVIQQLATALAEYGPMMFYGDTPQQERGANVERFQSDPRCRVAIVGISAAVGITLHAASHEIFVESDWVPANLSQAEDRAHRIGQKNAVLVQHLVLEGSLDAKMLKTVISKQEVIDDALDVEPGSQVQHARIQRRKVNYAEIGTSLDVYQRGSILQALGKLAAQDHDKAASRNGVGFSKFDSSIGNELARMPELTDGRAGYGQHLVRRYRRQLDPVLVIACGITID